MMQFQVVLSLWSVTSRLCIDTILEVAKTKGHCTRILKYSSEMFTLKNKYDLMLYQSRFHTSSGIFVHHKKKSDRG